jgi:PKD repeat protein
MKKWITSVVLGVLLIGGGVFCGVKIAGMTNQLNELELDYAVLQSKHTALESNYGSLEISYESLNSDHDLLQEKMAELQSAYNKLEANNENLQELFKKPVLELGIPEVAGLKVTVNGLVMPVTSTAEITNINWNWGDGSSTSSWFPATHTYAKGGTYTITVTAYDSNKISATRTTSVTI